MKRNRKCIVMCHINCLNVDIKPMNIASLIANVTTITKCCIKDTYRINLLQTVISGHLHVHDS